MNDHLFSWIDIQLGDEEEQAGSTAISPADETELFDSLRRVEKCARFLGRVWQPSNPGSIGKSSENDFFLKDGQCGRFEIHGLIGSGGMGNVFRAYDPAIDREVALKIPHPALLLDPKARKRFSREARAAGILRHPNIVRVLESGNAGAVCYIAFEYCEGMTLAKWIADRSNELDIPAAIRIAIATAEAVQHAHDRGVVHRDLKPSNILMDESLGSADSAADMPVPRVADFGLARLSATDATLTREGTAVGTAEFMAPEQSFGDPDAVGPASDQFSLGVILYQLLTGKSPFRRAQVTETLLAVQQHDPVYPSRFNRSISPDLDAVCLKALAKDPTNRYESVGGFADELQRVLDGKPTFARPISKPEQIVRWLKRNPIPAALAAVVAAFLVAVGTAISLHSHQVAMHAQELSVALADANAERKAAQDARDDAELQKQVASSARYRSDMRLAYDLWDRGQIHRVIRLLKDQARYDIDLRGPEWFVLNAEVDACYSEIGNCEGVVTECRLANDQKRIYSTGTDGVVRIWDRESHRISNSFPIGIGELHALALSADETVVAVGNSAMSDDTVSQVVLLDATTGRKLRELQTHETTIESISFSPDGKWLAAGSRYQPVQLTRLSDSKVFRLETGRRNRSVAFSTDSRHLAVATNDKAFTVWQLDNDMPFELHQLRAHALTSPNVCAFAPDSPIIATTYQNSAYINFFHYLQGSQAWLAVNLGNRSRSALPSCLAFTSDAKLLACGDDAGSIQIWEPNVSALAAATKSKPPKGPSAPQAEWTPHEGRITAIALTADETTISAGEDGRIVELNPFSRSAKVVRWTGVEFNGLATTNNELFMGCADGTVRRLEISPPSLSRLLRPAAKSNRSGTSLETFCDVSDPVRAVAVTPSGDLIVSGTDSGALWIHRRDAPDGMRCLVEKHGEGSPIHAIAISSDSSLVATASEDGTFTVYEIDSGLATFDRQLGGRGFAVAFHKHDRHLACGGEFDNVHVFDLHSGAEIAQVISGNTFAAANHPKSGHLVSIHRNGSLQIHNRDLSQSQIVFGHKGFGESIAFGPSGKTIVSLDHGGHVQFTDLASGAAYGRTSAIGPNRSVLNAKVAVAGKVIVMSGVIKKSNTSALAFWSLEELRDGATDSVPRSLNR